ncbi:hypothetical protein V866_000193 [Kwoniella sp. B9012]
MGSSLQAFWMCSQSLSSVVALSIIFETISFKIAQMFSMGLRSGEEGGWKRRSIPSSSLSATATLALWQGASSSTTQTASPTSAFTHRHHELFTAVRGKLSPNGLDYPSTFPDWWARLTSEEEDVSRKAKDEFLAIYDALDKYCIMSRDFTPEEIRTRTDRRVWTNIPSPTLPLHLTGLSA